MRGGKQYRTVQERLVDAHGESGAPTGVQSIVTNAQAIGGSALLVCATVTFQDGRIFTGLSEVPQGARSGAESTNPWEVAETSAVGRALAMAGYYGSDDGLAGAEEMREAQRRQGSSERRDEQQLRAASIRESPPPRQLRPVPTGAGPQPIGTAQRLTKDAQREATAAHQATKKSAAATFYDELAAIANAHDLADWVAPLNVDADDEVIVAHGRVLKARLQEAGLVDDRGRAVGTVA